MNTSEVMQTVTVSENTKRGADSRKMLKPCWGSAEK